MTTTVADPSRPPTLGVAAALTGLEGAALLVYALLEVVHVDADQPSVALTTAVFFALVGAGLAFCAAGLWRVRSWARSPVVVAQLITLLTAWGFVGGETTWVAAVLGGVSLVVLVSLLHPRSTRALGAHET